MENFPSIFPYNSSSSADHPPPDLSLSNMNYSMDDDDDDDHHNHHNNSHSNYIEFRGGDNHHLINDEYLGLVAKDTGLAIVNQSSSSTSPKAQDHQVISPNSSMVGSESNGVKMGMTMKKDKKKMKKPRYAFQTRSQVDILDDGYRWRKYGQKAVKNNNFPRSYYRCTYQGCNVKKQVQRLSKDEGVVVTTYEGMHSHPIDKSTDNFEHILTQMKIYSSS